MQFKKKGKITLQHNKYPIIAIPIKWYQKLGYPKEWNAIFYQGINKIALSFGPQKKAKKKYKR